MSKMKSFRHAALFAALALCVCAPAAAEDLTYVAAVEVVQHDADAPAGFADAIREALLTEAKFYGETGRPIVLKIDIDSVHFKNVAAAMLIGDDNVTRGHVSVVDQTSGQQLAEFKVRVDAEKPGDLAGEIALDVVGAFDPTGAVDMAHMAGDASSAEIDRVGTTHAMIVNFTAETLRETFGKARTRAAAAARETAAHAAAPQP